ncbi:uncharacterized protein PV07_05835 [Cladophialophora immunda]|uniref:FAD/NAD(P)-binding domain-containing protein n=1 Tax=Cladophialophora immunda TaxID=569365 RepID=A0A0D2CG41_9EURO|nr:uncharacterized protein PV07_05835 [Cladophialophora immunda]KIW30058.1 hypothetical protein PV07_05835 [Cladophialophora immunda]
MLGAGAAGIDFIHHAKLIFKDLDVQFVCYDKNPEVGGTCAWKWPDISGIKTFTRYVFHTANYDPGFDLTNKRVAIIESGSSGTQCVTAVYPEASKLYAWVVICATGFDTSCRMISKVRKSLAKRTRLTNCQAGPRFPITGLDLNQSLADKFAKEPSSYLAIGVDGYPNYLTYSGAYTPTAQGSLLPILSLLSKHFMQIVTKMRKEHIRRLSPKASIVRDFIEHANTFTPRTCWSDPCTSWFKQGEKDGSPIVWPGTRMAFFDTVKHPKFEDDEIEYWSKNRFGCLGSGFCTLEFDDSQDICWYLDELSGVQRF